jgi:hypothetical protein
LQELEILHIARAYLDDIHVLEKRQMLDAHYFGYNGQPRRAARGLEQAR